MSKVGRKNEATRENWIERSLKEIPSGCRILDAGAGEQPYKRLCSHLTYVSQDVAKYDGKGNGVGLQTGTFNFSGLDIICDITAIPEADNSFDAIMCTEVLEHIPDPIAALREFSRLIRPGGQLILSAPFCSNTHFAPYHFATGFNRYFYMNHLVAMGFDVIEMTANGNFFEFIAQEILRIASVATSYVTPPASLRERATLKLARALLLPVLERYSRDGDASSELLAFGLHVRAVKK